MSEPIEIAALEGTESCESLDAVTALLAERIARYTMGDSTSVPLDTAKRLLGGMAFCVQLHLNGAASAVPKDAPLKERFFAGVAEARRLTRRAKLMLNEAQRWQPPVVNTGFLDTLAALPSFFKWYNAEFFAQEIPCSIDYPLCQPVSDSFSGVEYMLDYLKRWLTESAFLRAFPRESLVELYEQYYGDYEDLLVNLYLPAAEAAILCALSNAPVRALRPGEGQHAESIRLICAPDEADARNAVFMAAKRACEELCSGSAFARDYLEQTALDLMVRLRATYTAGDVRERIHIAGIE
ncbi:MAG: DUF6179 domain-containing protein [Eubacteriales bacterium]|nr:DUF6179 domain-containing protein [Eubacteriales bacterium]